mmetsp:Transcript_6629/g.7215  ORF Transcript_6629/g.7215 Transcript_6629/m.7215 type:complete len:350 (-) Transcript_6629:449-1498(-)
MKRQLENSENGNKPVKRLKKEDKDSNPHIAQYTSCFGINDERDVCERVAKRVLILGDGDFSWAVEAKNKVFMHQDVVATGYESDSIVFVKYATAKANVDILREKEVKVLHGVDATNLQLDQFSDKFDIIVFNFPHHDGKGKIHLNRELLLKFFKSVQNVMSSGAKILVALAQGQGGTPVDKQRPKPGDHWQIVEQGAMAGLVLIKVLPFPTSIFCDVYKPTGRHGRDSCFHIAKSLVHVLVSENLGLRCLYPGKYKHHISFYINSGEVTKESFKEWITKTVFKKNVVGSLTLIDTYKCRKSGRNSQTYEIIYCGENTAVSKLSSDSLNASLRSAINLRDDLDLRDRLQE